MKRAVFISSAFALASLFAIGQPAFSQSQDSVRVLTEPVPAQESVRVTEGPARLVSSSFNEFKFSIPFAPAIRTITPDAPPPQTVINLITPPAPVCPVLVVQPEENPSASPVAIIGAMNPGGLTYNLSWSCTGYTGGCLITKNGEDYFKVDGDGILNNLPVDHFRAGTPVSETLVTIQIKSGSATDKWTYNGVIDSPTGPQVLPPVVPPVPVKTDAYASILNTGNVWLRNQDSLSGGSIISGLIQSYDYYATPGASTFALLTQMMIPLPTDAITYSDASLADGQVRLRSAFKVQAGEYLWKEFKKYKAQYSYGAGWGMFVGNPDATGTQTVTAQAFNYAYNTFRARSYQANCNQNPDSEWFDVGDGGLQYYNNPVTADRSVPLQTLYGPAGTPEAYVESQPFATHNKDEAPGNYLMLDFSLKIPALISSPAARDRLAVTDSYNPGGIPIWKQKIADALCIRLVQEDGDASSVQYFNFPTIWKDSGTFYVPPPAPPAPPGIPPTIGITSIKPGDFVPATGASVPGEIHTATINPSLVIRNDQLTNFKIGNIGSLTGPIYNYLVYGKVYGRPDVTPPPRHFSGDVAAQVLSPAPYQIFTAGAQNKIYWSGGAGSINLALWNGQPYTDAYTNPEGIHTYNPTGIIGYLAKNLSANGQILWDAKTICDYNGANCQPVSKFGSGPFYLSLTQLNIQNDPTVTISPDAAVRSGSQTSNVTLGSNQYPSAGPFFIESAPGILPLFTTTEKAAASAGFINPDGEGNITWGLQAGDYRLEIGLVDKTTKRVLAKDSVDITAGIPAVAITSPTGGTTLDINKPLTITWDKNQFLDPEANVSFTIYNYPDVGYYNLDGLEHWRYVYNTYPPISGKTTMEPEQGYATFNLKNIAKAKDGRATIDLRDTNLTGSGYNTAIARIQLPNWQSIEAQNPGQSIHATQTLPLKEYIKLGGTMNLSYLRLFASNGFSSYEYPVLPNGQTDIYHPTFTRYVSNAIDWTRSPLKIAGPVIEVPPPAAPGSAFIKVISDGYNTNPATQEVSSGVDANGVYFHNFIDVGSVPYNTPSFGSASYNTPVLFRWAFPQKGSCTTIGDTDVYSHSGSTLWNASDKSLVDMSANTGIVPQGAASIITNPKGGYRQKIKVGIQCTDGVTTERAMLELTVKPPLSGAANAPVVGSQMYTPTITLNGVQGYASPAGFVIPADGSQASNDIPEGSQFTVSWSAPGQLLAPQLKLSCDMFGAPLSLTDGRNWDRLTNMPTSGSVTLIAKDDQLPVVTYSGRKVRVFNLGVQCHSPASNGTETIMTKSAGLVMKIKAPAGATSTGNYTPYIPGISQNISADGVAARMASALTAVGAWFAGVFHLLFK